MTRCDHRSRGVPDKPFLRSPSKRGSRGTPGGQERGNGIRNAQERSGTLSGTGKLRNAQERLQERPSHMVIRGRGIAEVPLSRRPEHAAPLPRGPAAGRVASTVIGRQFDRHSDSTPARLNPARTASPDSGSVAAQPIQRRDRLVWAIRAACFAQHPPRPLRRKDSLMPDTLCPDCGRGLPPGRRHAACGLEGFTLEDGNPPADAYRRRPSRVIPAVPEAPAPRSRSFAPPTAPAQGRPKTAPVGQLGLLAKLDARAPGVL